MTISAPILRTTSRRQIADEAAIDQNLIAIAHGFENARDRHAGAHGLRQTAIAEDNFFASDQVGGDAAIGNWQIVERLQFGIREQFAVDQQTDLMTGIQAGRKGKAFLEAELDERWIVAEVLFAAIRKILVWGLAADDDVPVCAATICSSSRGLLPAA